jgi:hypothetical protein
MSTQHSTNIPIALSESRRQLDHWRSQQPNKRTRLPKELWQQAVALAREYGLNRTASALGLKYDSLKKHLHEAGADERCSATPQPDFIALLPGPVPPGGVECTIEWADGPNASVRMHIKGVGVSALTALAGVFRSGRT